MSLAQIQEAAATSQSQNHLRMHSLLKDFKNLQSIQKNEKTVSDKLND